MSTTTFTKDPKLFTEDLEALVIYLSALNLSEQRKELRAAVANFLVKHECKSLSNLTDLLRGKRFNPKSEQLAAHIYNLTGFCDHIPFWVMKPASLAGYNALISSTVKQKKFIYMLEVASVNAKSYITLDAFKKSAK
jgi:hypothetical protein